MRRGEIRHYRRAIAAYMLPPGQLIALGLGIWVLFRIAGRL